MRRTRANLACACACACVWGGGGVRGVESLGGSIVVAMT